MDLPGSLTLTFPHALLLGALLVWLFAKRLRVRNAWRWTLLALAIALLAYPSFVRRTSAVDLFVLVDRSRSIPEAARARELELLDLVKRRVEPGDRVGIISFNDRAYIEQAAGVEDAFKTFENPFSEDASDLYDGLDLALTQLEGRAGSRVFILSDGEYTGRDPAPLAQTARQRGVTLHYRNLDRPELFNLVVRDVRLPDEAVAGEPFRVAFTVVASSTAPARYRLYRNNRPVSEDWTAATFSPGENRLEFVDSPETPGIYGYRLEVESIPPERERVPEDNSAERFVRVVGDRPVLVVNGDGQPDNVSGVLRAGGVPQHIVAIDRLHMSIGQMSGYRGIVLNNVPLLALPQAQLLALRDFVLQEGGGLLVCGGARSYAMGGYYKSPLDPILPVSLEDRQHTKKVSTALSIVLDRSGSMAMTVPSGETKMDLANHAAAESLNLLSAADSLSVIAVDSSDHVIVPQRNVDDPGGMAHAIRSIESMGGGIFVYTGLVSAGNQIVRAPQANKHILLFADANDSEEPGDYKDLLHDYRAAGITVSVVGLGTENDSDSEFLRDVAARGGGTCYFTESPDQLVQFFTADTINYTRNSFVEEPSPIAVRVGAVAMAPEGHWVDFTCSHYNLLFARPGAEVALLTADEDAAPVLAFWQRELGRVAALAFWTGGPFGGTSQYGDMVLSAVRWTCGSDVEDTLLVDTKSEGNWGRIELEVSEEERRTLGQATAKIFTPGGDTLVAPLRWEGYNRLALDVKLSEKGLYRGVVEAGGKVYRIGPMSIPVSPEFLYEHGPGAGRETLGSLAAASGGREILDVENLFERNARARSVQPFVWPLLILFLVFMLLEIMEPRFGIQARLAATTRAARAASGRALRWRPSRGPAVPRREAPLHTESTEAFDETPTEPAPKAPPQPQSDPNLSYLSRTKQETRRRFKKDE